MTDNGGFTLNGVAVSDYGVTLRYAPDQPMLPDSRDRTSEVLNRAGQYWIDSTAGIRTFSLPCHFTSHTTAAELDTLIRAFAKVFVDSRGNAKQLKLILDDNTDVYYTVRYAGQIPFDRAWVGCTEFTLELVSDDPFAYETDEEYDIKTITTSGGSLTITSSGTVCTPAIIYVENTGAAEIADGFTIKIEQEIS